ncbi:carboxypeptidase-like regulatory domain-containing protein [Reichenbachiella ulvae]|uniref:Carboxypeptidase-like regulatory domain-containing protein n=1 Tax=Reichenbachiella ulvae TaxID=2980104 RepID=A0ABT3CXP7_9BACT|nr:carboxypeptidase-like regulatory domain-containing protein [Reichenbachiella ulvae]MCV9388260.1 carboxypeptidase-like regulatory domain-containing protein [Reichenbachiella ulvae]
MKFFSLFALLLVFQLATRAQTITIKGNVIDGQSIESLRDVNIFTQNGKGTYTDIDGNFSLKVFSGDTLHFKLLGYKEVIQTVSDSTAIEKMLISLTKATIVLENVQIRDDFQANTIIRNPNRPTYHVPGVYSKPKTEADDYHLGVMGSIVSPATAIYRATSDTYKQEKRLYEENLDRRQEDKTFEIAKVKMEELLDILDQRLDEYYYLDFIHYIGLDLHSFARRDVYELVQLMPDSLDGYFDQLDKKIRLLEQEQKKP